MEFVRVEKSDGGEYMKLIISVSDYHVASRYIQEMDLGEILGVREDGYRIIFIINDSIDAEFSRVDNKLRIKITL